MDGLEKAIKAEVRIREAIELLREAAKQEEGATSRVLAFYASMLGTILIDDAGNTGLEALIRQMGGI